MMDWLPLVGVGAVVLAILALLVMGIAFILARFYRKVDQGKALLINKMGVEPVVTFTGGVVLPIIHRAEVMDIAVKTIFIERNGHDGLICADNIRADIKVAFFVRVNKTKDDVLKVAQSIGCERASVQETLEELFSAKFSEGLKTVGKKMEFEQLYTQREDFKDQMLEVIGRHLNGYFLEDAAIDYLEQTPLTALDENNVMDAKGIRKITEITTAQNLKTNELRQNEHQERTRVNVEARENILVLERQQAQAEAENKREIATIQAREEAKIRVTKAEELQKAELARLEAEEKIQVGELNKQRQIEVTTKDKERVVAIKSEQVERDRQLEEIARNREVERQEIDKEMELEVKRKEIADVVRARIAVDKNVAEEEERIKDLRAKAEADRQAEVRVIGAKAEAEEDLVKSIKQAEARERVAEHKAKERLIQADADLQAADRIAQAKIKVAEGVQAEQAAAGLAEVRVKEANAEALEKEGLAQAKIQLEQLQAQARGEEEQGMAHNRVREKAVELDARAGEVEATVLRQRREAEAAGELADAAAIEAKGSAEAKALEERMRAEAQGLEAKLQAMQAMQGAAKEHEEFRIRMAQREKIELARLELGATLATEQAKVLAEAFGKADIQIMGGDGQFFDRFVQGASLSNLIDGFLENSDVARAALTPVLNGTAGVGDAIRGVIDAVKPVNGTPKPHTLPPRQMLQRLLATAEGEERAKLEALLAEADELGL